MYRWENPDRMAEYALLGENNTIVDRQRNKYAAKVPFQFSILINYFWTFSKLCIEN